jgi:uncharacterized membrane protein YgcG
VVAAVVVVVATGWLVLSAGHASAAEHVSGVECDGSQPDSDAEVASEFSTETIEAYRIEVVIDESGTATFTETITYAFNGAKHGIFRDIIVRQQCTDEYDRVYPFSPVSVSSAEAPPQFTIESPSPAVSNPSDAVNLLVNGSPIRRFKIGDPNRTVTGTPTYVIEYRLAGVVNGFDDHDEFYWNVIGNGWPVNIRNIEVTVRTPADATEAACYAGPTGSRSSCASADLIDGSAVFTQPALGPHQNLTVLASFPAGVVENPAPLLEERWSLAGAFDPSTAVLVIAVLLTVGVIVGWSVLAYKVGRDRQMEGSAVDVAFAPVGTDGVPVPLFGDDHAPVEYVPPDGILPGQVGLLIDEVAHPVDITATLIDLSVKGYVRIDEIERRFRRDDYEITRLNKDIVDLAYYERLLLTKLLSSPGQQKKLSDLKNTFAESFKKVVDALYDDGIDQGWFHGRPDKTRTKWKAGGISLFVVSLLLFVAAVLFTSLAVLVVPLLVGGLFLWFGARFMPRRTAAGTGLLRRVQGFEEFIRDSEAPRAQWAENRNIFSEYLPYAIVFRCADKWAKTFEDLGDEALGDAGWYQGDSFSAAYIASSMSSFNSSATSSLTSSPASSGSGGGGGGSSGGGGGGGGGGSW